MTFADFITCVAGVSVQAMRWRSDWWAGDRLQSNPLRFTAESVQIDD